jgi:hypothetical protein
MRLFAALIISHLFSGHDRWDDLKRKFRQFFYDVTDLFSNCFGWKMGTIVSLRFHIILMRMVMRISARMFLMSIILLAIYGLLV